ncbi:MAG: class I SAM-dependent methyltransferase [Nitrospirae bacterium]|nr:class I SAM-dependent methyltransferase [Nitrospirota bacterium]
MERIPEPDLMDDTEQARAYAETDFSEAHDAFVSHFKSRFPDFDKGHVLDLGCGTADVIIRFARAFPGCNITGVDGAQAMLDIGMRDVKARGCAHQIRLHRCLLPDYSLSSKCFDAVISNSLLHHLNNPLIIWDTIRKCAGQGTPIFVMDLIRPESPEEAGKLVQLYAGDASPILRKDFYNSLLAAYKPDEIIHQLKTNDLDYLTVEVVSDRHVLAWGTKR